MGFFKLRWIIFIQTEDKCRVMFRMKWWKLRAKIVLVVMCVITVSLIGTNMIVRCKDVVTKTSTKTHTHEEIGPNKSSLPMIYAITPTIYRPEQRADLTRLSHTLRLVPRLHWVVVEDSDIPTTMVTNLLDRSQMSYTHLTKKTSDKEWVRKKYNLTKSWHISKGVEQRNVALQWITTHTEFPSVFYCCDDDNTYDLGVFEEMRYTKKLSVWPVGLIAQCDYETPVVKQGKVVGWVSCWSSNRTFPIDMAGFAVNTHVLRRQNPPRFNMTIKYGYLEPGFLSQIVNDIGELEPKADNCTKVLVWHTKTKSALLRNNKMLTKLLAKYGIPRISEV